MKFEGIGPPECSPPARRRRAALEADGSDESLLSEETSAENARPRAMPAAAGGPSGTGTGTKNKKRPPVVGGR